MAFDFTDEKYRWGSRWTAVKKDVAVEILNKSVANDWTTGQTISQWRAAGVSYRRTDMLHDIALAKSTEWSGDAEARQRAVGWFERIEAIRAQSPGMTTKQAKALHEKWRTESEMSLKEAALVGDLEGLGIEPGDS